MLLLGLEANAAGFRYVTKNTKNLPEVLKTSDLGARARKVLCVRGQDPV